MTFLPPGITVHADLTGGLAEPRRYTINGVRKVLLRLDKGDVDVQMTLSPAEAADFADELQAVIDWLSE